MNDLNPTPNATTTPIAALPGIAAPHHMAHTDNLFTSNSITPSTSSSSEPAAAFLTRGVPNARFIPSNAAYASNALSPTPWPRGFTARYQLQDIIGHGASSEVFGARVIETNESVAVKRVFKRRCCVGARATRRLRDEVRVLSTLRHPHIVEMREVWETPTELYIVMERAHGGELFDRIVERGNFSEYEAKIVMRQLLSALCEMHCRGVLHRDVKPENLLLTTKEGWDIKLSDFGLVKTLEHDDDTFVASSQPVQHGAVPPLNLPLHPSVSVPQHQPMQQHMVPSPTPMETRLGGAERPNASWTSVMPRLDVRELHHPYEAIERVIPLGKGEAPFGSAPLISEPPPASTPPWEQEWPPPPGLPPEGLPDWPPVHHRRRPSWGEALEPVDEQSAQHYVHTHDHSEGGGLSTSMSHIMASTGAQAPVPSQPPSTGGIDYYYATARGLDVRLNAPYVASSPSASSYLSEEEAFALLSDEAAAAAYSASLAYRSDTSIASDAAVGPHHPPFDSSAERDVAMLFRSAPTHTLCGSPYYMAPEVCYRERYGTAVDVWSAGVVMYILLTGSPPWEKPPQFGAPPPLNLEGDLAAISKLGVDLLIKMLKPQPEERCTAAEALHHPWLILPVARPWPMGMRIDHHSFSEPSIHPHRGLSPTFDSAIRKFCEKRKRSSTSANLDMTPVSRALGGLSSVDARDRLDVSPVPAPSQLATWESSPFPMQHEDLVLVKKNRAAATSPDNRAWLSPTLHQHDYDTFSSEGSDDEEDVGMKKRHDTRSSFGDPPSRAEASPPKNQGFITFNDGRNAFD